MDGIAASVKEATVKVGKERGGRAHVSLVAVAAFAILMATVFLKFILSRCYLSCLRLYEGAVCGGVEGCAICPSFLRGGTPCKKVPFLRGTDGIGASFAFLCPFRHAFGHVRYYVGVDFLYTEGGGTVRNGRLSLRACSVLVFASYILVGSLPTFFVTRGWDGDVPFARLPAFVWGRRLGGSVRLRFLRSFFDFPRPSFGGFAVLSLLYLALLFI